MTAIFPCRYCNFIVSLNIREVPLPSSECQQVQYLPAAFPQVQSACNIPQYVLLKNSQMSGLLAATYNRSYLQIAAVKYGACYHRHCRTQKLFIGNFLQDVLCIVQSTIDGIISRCLYGHRNSAIFFF